jgi:iron complex outermembrane receptor protein
MRSSWAALAAIIAASDIAAAADSENEIVVIGERRRQDVVKSLDDIDAAAISRAGARDLADALRLAPGVVVRANSRGETLPFIPASGEREVSIFLGAAPLNIPWDNRVDLAVVPASAVDVLLLRGAGAISAGARSSAGRVDLLPDVPDDGALRFAGRAEGSTGPAYALEAALKRRSRSGAVVLAASHVDDEGSRLSDPDRAPFSQIGHDRTNDDLRRASVLGYGALLLGGGEFEITALFSIAEQGVPPESDRNPAASTVRYWRRPEQRLFAASGETEIALDDKLEIGAGVWGQTYDQTIENYANAAYATLLESQIDDNASVGGRAFIARSFDDGLALTLEAIASSSRHKERIDRATRGATDFYREAAQSAGASFGGDLPGGGRGFVRVGADRVATPETAGRTPRDPFVKPYAGAEGRWPVSGGVSVGGQISYKARPPTLRELYGVALNRFVPNADLQPETSVYGEINAAFEGDRATLTLAGFARSVDNTLEQRAVVVAGESLRQRINLEGSTSLGLVASAEWRAFDHWTLSGDAAVLHERPRGAAGPARLTERPRALARARVEYENGPFNAFAEAERLGGAYSLDGAGALISLDGATIASFGAAHALANSGVEAYVRLTNAFDSFYQPQAGLPSDGRRASVGVRIER